MAAGRPPLPPKKPAPPATAGAGAAAPFNAMIDPKHQWIFDAFIRAYKTPSKEDDASPIELLITSLLDEGYGEDLIHTIELEAAKAYRLMKLEVPLRPSVPPPQLSAARNPMAFHRPLIPPLALGAIVNEVNNLNLEGAITIPIELDPNRVEIIKTLIGDHCSVEQIAEIIRQEHEDLESVHAAVDGVRDAMIEEAAKDFINFRP